MTFVHQYVPHHVNTHSHSFIHHVITSTHSNCIHAVLGRAALSLSLSLYLSPSVHLSHILSLSLFSILSFPLLVTLITLCFDIVAVNIGVDNNISLLILMADSFLTVS